MTTSPIVRGRTLNQTVTRINTLGSEVNEMLDQYNRLLDDGRHTAAAAKVNAIANKLRILSHAHLEASFQINTYQDEPVFTGASEPLADWYLTRPI